MTCASPLTEPLRIERGTEWSVDAIWDV